MIDNTIPNDVRYILLLILEKDGNIEQLKNIGYNYDVISDLINKELSEKTVLLKENKFELTDYGLKIKADLFNVLNYKNIENLISPQLSTIISNKNENFFIPDANELPD